jgi:serine protease Do
MFAFPAAKRTIVLIMSVALIVSAYIASAGEDQGYLGVILQDVTPSMAKALQMDEKTGVMINEVVDESPAAKAGFEDGDVILEFNGKTISSNGELTKAVQNTSPGDNVKVVVLRGGKNKTIDVEVGEKEFKNVYFFSDGNDAHAPHAEHFGGEGSNVWVMSGDEENFSWNMDNEMVMEFNPDRGYLGVHLDDINEQMGEYFGVEDGKGALVTEVVEDSPAAAAGLKAGDVIVQIGENEVDSSSGLHQAIADTKPEQQMAVKVMRKGQSKSVSITLGEMPENSYSTHMEFSSEGDNHFTVHSAPTMLKHFNHSGGSDVDVRVIRSGGAHGKDIEVHGMHEMEEAHQELKVMRSELDNMREELEKMKKELDQ